MIYYNGTPSSLKEAFENLITKKQKLMEQCYWWGTIPSFFPSIDGGAGFTAIYINPCNEIDYCSCIYCSNYSSYIAIGSIYGSETKWRKIALEK